MQAQSSFMDDKLYRVSTHDFTLENLTYQQVKTFIADLNTQFNCAVVGILSNGQDALVVMSSKDIFIEEQK